MAGRCTRLSPIVMLALVMVSPGASGAAELLHVSRTVGPTPQSSTERFTFNRAPGAEYPHMALVINLRQGRADVRVMDPAGRPLQSLGAEQCTLDAAIPNAREAGTYTVEVTTGGAVGEWDLRIYGGPPPRPKAATPALFSAGLMLLVAACSVWFWRWHSGVAWRWFWAGAGLWGVAVAVKFAIAIPATQPLLGMLDRALPRWAYLSAGSIYGGAMTGITEVLFTFFAALIWRRLAASADRGIAIGVGAGAVEAGLLAIGAGAAALAIGAGATTWSAALAAPIERIIAILCHVASRALVLLGVACHRRRLFWYGFALLSSIDGIAMFLHLTNRVATMSPLLMEALLAPFAVISIPIIAWCIRKWPLRPQPTAEASVVDVSPVAMQRVANT